MVDGDSIPSAWTTQTKGNLLKTLANPDVQAELGKNGQEIDYTAVAAMLEQPSCDTASVENTTLLIEDLQQQLQDERASIVALEGQVQNQADLIKKQEADIDQDLTAIANLLGDRSRFAKQAEMLGIEKSEVSLAASWLLGAWFSLIEENDKLVRQAKCLDDRCNRQRNSITLYQEQEETAAKEISGLHKAIEFWKQRSEFWRKRAHTARELAMTRKDVIRDLERHPIRQWFRRAWESTHWV